MPVSERTSSSSYERSGPTSGLLSRVPRKQPRKPIGIVTRPGNVSDDGEPWESGPGQTGGERTIITTEATIPHAMPVRAPVVLKRRQSSASSSGGKLAEAANTHPLETRTVTLKPQPIARGPRIAAAPTPAEAVRAALRSAPSGPRPGALRRGAGAVGA